MIKFDPTPLSGAVTVTPDAFADDRGFFYESFRSDRFAEHGIPIAFLQDNHSRSRRGVVRGLHFQWQPPMGKLMRVTVGAAFLVAVDIRKGSPTFGKWIGVEASAENRKQLWAPAGFARGFCALTDCEVQYKCTGLYNSQAESGIHWNDPEIGIAWPIPNPQLSAKDANAQSFAQWQARPESEHFRFDPARPNE